MSEQGESSMNDKPFLPQAYTEYVGRRVPKCICPKDDGADIPGWVRISPNCPIHFESGVAERPGK